MNSSHWKLICVPLQAYIVHLISEKIVENENISHFGGQLVTDQVSHNKAMRADIEMKAKKYP